VKEIGGCQASGPVEVKCELKKDPGRRASLSQKKIRVKQKRRKRLRNAIVRWLIEKHILKLGKHAVSGYTLGEITGLF
jgi:hypothetical protein